MFCLPTWLLLQGFIASGIQVVSVCRCTWCDVKHTMHTKSACVTGLCYYNYIITVSYQPGSLDCETKMLAFQFQYIPLFLQIIIFKYIDDKDIFQKVSSVTSHICAVTHLCLILSGLALFLLFFYLILLVYCLYSSFPKCWPRG